MPQLTNDKYIDLKVKTILCFNFCLEFFKNYEFIETVN